MPCWLGCSSGGGGGGGGGEGEGGSSGSHSTHKSKQSSSLSSPSSQVKYSVDPLVAAEEKEEQGSELLPGALITPISRSHNVLPSFSFCFWLL